LPILLAVIRVDSRLENIWARVREVDGENEGAAAAHALRKGCGKDLILLQTR